MTLTHLFRQFSVIASAALIVTAVGLKPIYAAGTDTPSDDKKKEKKGSAIEEQDRQIAQSNRQAGAGSRCRTQNHHRDGKGQQDAESTERRGGKPLPESQRPRRNRTQEQWTE